MMNLDKTFFSAAFTAACLVAFVSCAPQTEQEPEAPEPETYSQVQQEPTPEPDAQDPIVFVDMTEEAGIDFIHENGYSGEKYLPETMGSGGGFFDYDNDGDQDLLLINARWFGPGQEDKPETPSALYRNDGDWRFIDVSAESGLNVNLYGMGCVMADVDADGDQDVFITSAIDGQRFFVNNGDGSFTDKTEAAGLVSPTWTDDEGREHNYWSTSAAFFDYDRDGWLDLVVCNYVQWSVENDIFTTRAGMGKSFTIPTLYKGLTPLLYRNRGDGTFENVTESSGVYNPEGKSLGVAVADINHDGWLDFAIANDSTPNFLYLNNQDGTFTESALAAGVAFDENGRARAGMGIDYAPGLDGEWTLAIGNFSHEPISLYTKIQDDVFFIDKAGASRISRPSLLTLTFGLVFFDYDLDGWLDLAAANGHIEPDINLVEKNVTFKQPPQLFRGVDGQRFEDISDELGAGFVDPMVARGAAYADLDMDGDLDFLLTGCGEAPRLFRNDDAAAQNNWIRFRLIGSETNRDAIGAILTLGAGGRERIKMVRTGSSYLSQNEFTLTFGMGEIDAVESVSIQWPDGSEMELSGDEVTMNQNNIVAKNN